jgi:hypothetical protein
LVGGQVVTTGMWCRGEKKTIAPLLHEVSQFLTNGVAKSTWANPYPSFLLFLENKKETIWRGEAKENCMARDGKFIVHSWHLSAKCYP